MGPDQVVIFVLTYLGGIALKKWPEYKNEYIPRAVWILAIFQQALTNLAGIGTVHTIAPAYAAAFASYGVPVQAALPLGGDVAALLAGTKVWLATQVFHLVVEKALLKGLFRVKLPW